MTHHSIRLSWRVLVLVCGTALASASPSTEIERVSQDAIASLTAKNYGVVVDQLHCARTVPEQARIEDRRSTVGLLRVVFDDFDGLPRARRASDLDSAQIGTGFILLGLFAGDEADWRAESARFVQHTVCYRVSRKGNGALVIAFRYIDVNGKWELLDIQLMAPAGNSEAVSQLTELGRRVFDYLRAGSVPPRT